MGKKVSVSGRGSEASGSSSRATSSSTGKLLGLEVRVVAKGQDVRTKLLLVRQTLLHEILEEETEKA